MRDAARRVVIATGETVLSVRDYTAMLADLTMQGLDPEEATAEMATTKTLADFPTLAAKLAEVLSQPPEFGARQPYGGGFEVSSAPDIGHADIDVGLRAGTTEVTFVAITGEYDPRNKHGEREQICADALALVRTVASADPQWDVLSNLDARMAVGGALSTWQVIDGVRVDVLVGGHRLDLSCEPA